MNDLAAIKKEVSKHTVATCIADIANKHLTIKVSRGITSDAIFEYLHHHNIRFDLVKVPNYQIYKRAHDTVYHITVSKTNYGLQTIEDVCLFKTFIHSDLELFTYLRNILHSTIQIKVSEHGVYMKVFLTLKDSHKLEQTKIDAINLCKAFMGPSLLDYHILNDNHFNDFTIILRPKQINVKTNKALIAITELTGI